MEAKRLSRSLPIAVLVCKLFPDVPKSGIHISPGAQRIMHVLNRPKRPIQLEYYYRAKLPILILTYQDLSLIHKIALPLAAIATGLPFAMFIHFFFVESRPDASVPFLIIFLLEMAWSIFYLWILPKTLTKKRVSNNQRS